MESPRVHPEFTTSLTSSLLTKAVSASSIAMVGPHLSIDRNNAGPVIETLDRPLRTRKEMTFSSVVLPLSGNGEVTSKMGLCTTAFSCTHVMVTQVAQANACGPSITT